MVCMFIFEVFCDMGCVYDNVYVYLICFLICVLIFIGFYVSCIGVGSVGVGFVINIFSFFDCLN